LTGTLIVTGGGRGIGAAVCEAAAARGYAVCVNYRGSEDAAHRVVAGIEAGGGSAVAVAGDVSVEADVVALFDAAEDELGPVVALVNNAGILGLQTTLAELERGRFERVLAINVLGTFLCAREAVRRMSTARGGAGGAIVNVSSMAARLGAPNEYIDYAASKGAVDSLTTGLAKEVAREGIRVNAVRPGLIRTDIHASGGEPGRVARLQDTIPLGRGGEAKEVASTVLWLLSEEASYVTGTFIDVAGGR